MVEEINKSRTVYAKKNFIWSMISIIISSALGFLSRGLFVSLLGEEVLGISGLFISLLAILSLAELGVGSAINYALYKPLAEGNKEKIKSLMKFYQKTYRIIALVVAGIGLLFLPFLQFIIKDFDKVAASTGINIYLVFGIFLFDASFSYLFTYKRTLINADQKGYTVTNFTSFLQIATIGLQITMLWIFRNYYVYLAVNIFVNLLFNVIINNFINKQYPYLKDKDVQPLDDEENKKIKKNISALVIHKVGGIAVTQSGTIIISTFISIIVVGILSNYSLVMGIVSGFLALFGTAARAGFGNLAATSSKEKQLKAFDALHFLTFWTNAFAAACFIALFQPFILIWFVKPEMLLSILTVILIVANQYLSTQRNTVFMFKEIKGIFVEDQILPIIQAAVNIALAIALVLLIRDPDAKINGVFAAAIASSIIVNIMRPKIVYNKALKMSSKPYFAKFGLYLFITITVCVITYFAVNFLVDITDYTESVIHGGRSLTNVALFSSFLIVALIIPNLIIWLIFRKSEEYKELIRVIKGMKKKKTEKKADADTQN